MKLAKLILSAVMIFSACAGQALTPVVFTPQDSGGNAEPGLRIRVTPRWTPGANGGAHVGNDFFDTVTGSDGSVTTNIVAGLYDISYLWTNKTTSFRIQVPDTNVAQSASSLMTTNAIPGQTFTTGASDLRYLRRSNDLGTELRLYSSNSPAPAAGYVWTMTGTNGAGAWSNSPAGSAGGTTNAISTVRTNGILLTAAATELRFFNFTKLTNASGVISLEQDVNSALMTATTNGLYTLLTNVMTISSNGIIVQMVAQSNSISARLVATNTALLSVIAAQGTALTNLAGQKMASGSGLGTNIQLEATTKILENGVETFDIYSQGTNFSIVDMVTPLTIFYYDFLSQAVLIPKLSVSGITNSGGYSGPLVSAKIAPTNATASRAAEINSTGVLSNSVTTSAELAFVSGVTAGIQGQLDGKGSLAALNTVSNNQVTLTAAVNAGSNTTATVSNDVRNLKTLQTNWSAKAGGGLISSLNNGTNGAFELALTNNYESFAINAGAWMPVATNSATNGVFRPGGTDQVNDDSWDFDDAAVEAVQYKLRMPDNWDRGAIKFGLWWGESRRGTNFPPSD